MLPSELIPFTAINLETDSDENRAVERSQLDVDGLIVLYDELDLSLFSTLGELNLPASIELHSGSCTF